MLNISAGAYLKNCTPNKFVYQIRELLCFDSKRSPERQSTVAGGADVSLSSSAR